MFHPRTAARSSQATGQTSHGARRRRSETFDLLNARAPRLLVAASATLLGFGGAGCASLFTMPGSVEYLRVQVDSLSLRQAETESTLAVVSRNVNRQEGFVRSSRADQNSKIDQLLDRTEAVASNLEETTRQLSRLGDRLTLVEGRLETSGAPAANAGTPPEQDTMGSTRARSDSASTAAQIFGAAAEARGRGQLDRAASGFARVVSQWPKSPLAAEAQYQIGEVREEAGSHEQALTAFRRLVSDYPSSARVPRAMLHAAYALEALGERDAARQTLQSLISAYGNTQEAATAREHLAAPPSKGRGKTTVRSKR
jgi:tol-pal system protein YbgF